MKSASMVLRVAAAVWQQTVTALAAVTSASIIDISEPTENLVWELGELERLYPGRCIVIGEHARITRWGDAADDRKGMCRFAHALYGLLLELPAASPPS